METSPRASTRATTVGPHGYHETGALQARWTGYSTIPCAAVAPSRSRQAHPRDPPSEPPPDHSDRWIELPFAWHIGCDEGVQTVGTFNADGFSRETASLPDPYIRINGLGPLTEKITFHDKLPCAESEDFTGA